MRGILQVCLLVLLAAAALPRLHPDLALAVAALADSDDDDDDDDDGGGGSAGRGWDNDDDDDDGAPMRRGARQRPQTPAVLPLPDHRPEIVVLDLLPEDLAGLIALGFGIIEETSLPALASRAHRLRAPATLSLEAARQLMRERSGGALADFNHFYRTSQSESCAGPHCSAFAQVAWSPAGAVATCGAAPRLGMIDTGINAAHAAFANADLVLHRLETADGPASGALHGTSVAALLVGDRASRTPGLTPEMPLVAVDAFARAGADERTDAFTLLRALDLLAGAKVRVANLSLAGPENLALSAALTRLVAERGMVIVAAAGNGGPHAAPAWPAAHADVIAVTAVDGSGNVYRRANQGGHIDLAAPGVGLWTAASVSGGRLKSGTSFAAPFVTAAAARLLRAEPELSAAEVAARLAQAAQDLGAPGRDPVFGHGLLSFPLPGC